MDVQHLIEFAEVARTLNFTEAAEALHMTQPTLSKHIASMETELGVRLLDRAPSNVTLTEAGFYIQGVAQEVVGIVERAQRELAAMKARRPIVVDGRLEDDIISGLLMAASEISKEQRRPPIVFNHRSNRPLHDLLLADEIDVLIDMPQTRDWRDNDQLVHRPILARPMSVLMARTHRFAERETLSIADLRDEVFLQLTWNHFESGWNTIVELCERAGFAPRCKLRPVRSLAEGLSAPLDDMVLVVPGDTPNLQFLSPASYACIPLSDNDARFTTCVIYRTENTEKVAPFVESLDEALERVDADRLV